MSHISVGSFHRRSEKKAHSNEAPVCITVRVQGCKSPGMYNSGLDLTAKDYERADRRNPQGIAAQYAEQIRTARTRIEQLACLLNPFSFDVLRELIDKLKKTKADIFIDLNYPFDARQLAAVFISPDLLAPVVRQEETPAMGAQLPVVYQPLIVQPAINPQWSFMRRPQEEQTGLMKFMPKNDSNVQQWMEQLEENIGTSDHPIFQEFDPTANILEWMDILYKQKDVPAYSCAKEAMIRFFKAKGMKTTRFGKDQKEEEYIPFFAIVKKTLEKMEEWWLKQGGLTRWGNVKPMTMGTVRAYMSNIRSTIQHCIDCKLLPEDMMPFGGVNEVDKYCLPESQKRDISFQQEDFEAFLQYKPEKRNINDGRKKKWKLGPYSEEEAHDILMFMYISNGFNARDFIKMKYSWFDSQGYFSFKRSKMEKKKNHNVVVQVKVTKEHERFIEKYATKDKSPDNYVFPILFKEEKRKVQKAGEEHQPKLIPITDPKEIAKAGRSFLAQLNRYFNEILEKLGIDKKTSYAIREQFANDLIDAGADSKAAARDLGHKGMGAIDFYIQKRDRKRDVDAKQGLVDRVTKGRKVSEKKRGKTHTAVQKKGGKTRPMAPKKTRKAA